MHGVWFWLFVGVSIFAVSFASALWTERRRANAMHKLIIDLLATEEECAEKEEVNE